MAGPQLIDFTVDDIAKLTLFFKNNPVWFSDKSFHFVRKRESVEVGEPTKKLSNSLEGWKTPLQYLSTKELFGKPAQTYPFRTRFLQRQKFSGSIFFIGSDTGAWFSNSHGRDKSGRNSSIWIKIRIGIWRAPRSKDHLEWAIFQSEVKENQRQFLLSPNISLNIFTPIFSPTTKEDRDLLNLPQLEAKIGGKSRLFLTLLDF